MIDARTETFLTLYRVMNYRRTAEILNMTQPAVTQHIHFLEEQYGCKLFIYDKRVLRKTKEAEILRKYAENVIYQEKKLISELSDEKGINISVGATKTIGEYVIADHISDFLSFSENNISLNVDNTENLLSELSSGKLDFALIEGNFDRSRYAYRLYRKESFVGICGKNHPFANRVVALDEILKENLILREEGSGTRNILGQFLSENNHSFSEFRKITTISSFSIISKLLCDNNSITFAYRAFALKNDSLSEFTVKGRKISREFNYVYLDTPYSRYAVDYFDSSRNKSDTDDK